MAGTLSVYPAADALLYFSIQNSSLGIVEIEEEDVLVVDDTSVAVVESFSSSEKN